MLNLLFQFFFAGYNWKNAVVPGSPNKVTFNAINKASADAILKEVSGTDIAMTIVKDGTLQGEKSLMDRKEPLRYKAYKKQGESELFINGKNEYKMESLTAGGNLVFVIHNSEGFDWKSAAENINSDTNSGKSFSFIAPNIYEGEDVTLIEQSGTEIQLDISKGDIYQFSVPSENPDSKKIFQFKATTKSSKKPVLVNGQNVFSANPSLPLAPLTALVIHKEGILWFFQLLSTS